MQPIHPLPGLHLVTGGSGYLGSLLAKTLVGVGVPVRILDLCDAEDRPPSVEFIQGDIRRPAAVDRACRGASVIYHCVAQVPLAKSVHAFWSVNCDGTRYLLDAALHHGVQKFIHMSSSAVFGIPARNPVDEAVCPAPGEAYGRAKLAAEILVRRYGERGLDATVIRPRTILGHGRLGIMQILFEWIRKGRNVPVLGRGSNLYQFIHADDLIDACIRAESRAGFRVYHIGAEQFGTMRELLEGLILHAKSRSRIVEVPERLAASGMKATSALQLSPLGAYHALMYGQAMYFDLERAKSELGWAPRFSNHAMICQSYDWYLEHRDDVFNFGPRSHHRSAVKHGILELVSQLLRLC